MANACGGRQNPGKAVYFFYRIKRMQYHPQPLTFFGYGGVQNCPHIKIMLLAQSGGSLYLFVAGNNY